MDKRMAQVLKRQPAFATLCDQLLACGGNAVYAPKWQPLLDALLERGQELTNPVRHVDGLAHRCHANTLAYVNSHPDAALATGWGLDASGSWVQHSWPMEQETIVETTPAPILRYYGILAQSEAEEQQFLMELKALTLKEVGVDEVRDWGIAGRT